MGELAVGNSCALWVCVGVCAVGVMSWTGPILLFLNQTAHQTIHSTESNPSASALHVFENVGKIEVWHSHLDCTCW